MRALAAAGSLLQQAGGAHGQVAVGRHAGNGCGEHDIAIVARGEAQGIGAADEAEDGLQQVVAVGPAADDVQEEVELGRGRPGTVPGPVIHGRALHSSIRSFSSISPGRLM